MSPVEISASIIRAGLDGAVLTDHDVLWTWEEVEALAPQRDGVRLYRGIECTAKEAHVLAIGLADAGGIPRGCPVAEVCELSHARRAAVVLAHPFRSASPLDLPLELMDAIEVASTSFSREESRRSRQLARASHRPQVAGSDAHALSRIGWAWTELPHEPVDEIELADMIRKGLGRPVVPRGRWAS